MIDFDKLPDEDLIPGFKCVRCGGNVCKDEVSKRLDSGQWDCICIYCDTEVEDD